jgi:hypothetical protein
MVSRTASSDRCRGGQTDPVIERDQVTRIGPNGARRRAGTAVQSSVGTPTARGRPN